MELPGLGTVDLQAVKEQLALLGHDVPDHVIGAFLTEMAEAGEAGALAVNQLNRPDNQSSPVSQGMSAPVLSDALGAAIPLLLVGAAWFFCCNCAAPT